MVHRRADIIILSVLGFLLVTELSAQSFQPFSYGWSSEPGTKGYSDTETHTGLMITPTLSDFGQPPLTTENLYERLYTVRLVATTESVCGGQALRVNFDSGSTPAVVFHYDVVTADNLPASSGGLTFYAKASHDMNIMVSQEWYGVNPYETVFEVTTDWQKIDIPRSYFTQEWIPFYIFSTESQNQAGFLLIDRIGTEDPFEVAPALDVQPNIDTSISSNELFTGSQYLGNLRSRLENKESINIYGWGDSIAAGARINQSSTEHPIIDRGWSGDINDRFFGRLAAKLREHYQYGEITAFAKAHGGDQLTSSTAIEFKNEILSEASPGDLVLIEFGANDMNYGVSASDMAVRLGSAIDEFYGANLNVIVMTPPPCEQWDMVDAALEPGLTTEMEQLSSNKQVAVVNNLKFFTYRENEFAFAQESNNCHPSFWGHELMAQFLFALIAGKSFTWSPDNDFPQRQWEDSPDNSPPAAPTGLRVEQAPLASVRSGRR